MSKKHKVSAEEGQRWFIWTLVVIFVSLGGLAVYVYNISLADNASIPIEMLNYQSQATKPMSAADLLGTTWVSQDKTDNTLITFMKTKYNDPKHQAYDYRVATGTRVDEVGYWTASAGDVEPILTRVPGLPHNIQRMYVTQNAMFVYTTTATTPLKFVQFGISSAKAAK